MRLPLLISVAFAIACSWQVVAAQSNDRAVITAFKHADASLAFSRVWQRVDVGDGMDLVVTLGGPQPWKPLPSGAIAGGTTRIGIFVQEQRNPATVYLITVAPAFSDCDSASLARATRTDLVVWCISEKSALQPAQKFVYDIRAKALIGQFDFGPFTNYTMKHGANGQLSLRAESPTRRVALTLTPPAGLPW